MRALWTVFVRNGVGLIFLYSQGPVSARYVVLLSVPKKCVTCLCVLP